LIALLAEFDGRPWAGVDLFFRGANPNVVLPAATSGTTERIYDDLVSLLNGRASESVRSFPASAASLWTGAGSLTVTLTTDDRINFTTDVEGFEILASASGNNEPWGIPAGGSGAVLAGPPGYTTPNEWTRGNITARPFINPDVGGLFQVPAEAARYQDAVIAFREAGVTLDEDDLHATDNLEHLDNDQNDPASRRYQWGITDDGFVYWAAPTVTATAISWLSITFRDALGFDGSEVVTVDGALSYSIATNRPPSGMFPSRPLIRQTRQAREVSRARRVTDGRWASNHVGTYQGWELEFYLDGPADKAGLDQHRHLLEQWLEVVTHGRRVTLYQDWGDSRRADDVPNLGLYGLLYTVEEGGYRGRLRLRMDPATGADYDAKWPDVFRRRKPIRFTFTDDERGQ